MARVLFKLSALRLHPSKIFRSDYGSQLIHPFRYLAANIKSIRQGEVAARAVAQNTDGHVQFGRRFFEYSWISVAGTLIHEAAHTLQRGHVSCLHNQAPHEDCDEFLSGRLDEDGAFGFEIWFYLSLAETPGISVRERREARRLAELRLLNNVNNILIDSLQIRETIWAVATDTDLLRQVFPESGDPGLRLSGRRPRLGDVPIFGNLPLVWNSGDFSLLDPAGKIGSPANCLPKSERVHDATLAFSFIANDTVPTLLTDKGVWILVPKTGGKGLDCRQILNFSADFNFRKILFTPERALFLVDESGRNFIANGSKLRSGDLFAGTRPPYRQILYSPRETLGWVVDSNGQVFEMEKKAPGPRTKNLKFRPPQIPIQKVMVGRNEFYWLSEDQRLFRSKRIRPEAILPIAPKNRYSDAAILPRVFLKNNVPLNR